MAAAGNTARGSHPGQAVVLAEAVGALCVTELNFGEPRLQSSARLAVRQWTQV